MNDLNVDSSGLLQVFNIFNRRNNESDLNGLDFHYLTDIEIEIAYRNSTILQKIVEKYPNESKTLGYQVLDNNGNIIDRDDDTLLEAFKNASIFARLYGRAYLYLEFQDNLPNKPVKLNAKLQGYKILFFEDVLIEGDFYKYNSEIIHKSRVLEFYGKKTYKKIATKKDKDYSDSILQGLYKSYNDYINNNIYAKKLLENLSYLTIGIDNLGNMTKSAEGRNIIFERLSSINVNRNVTRLLAYDRKFEDIGFISQTLSGVTDVINEIKELFVSETDYPYTEIFERSQSQALGSGIQNQLVARYLWARRVRNWSINNWLPNLKKYFSTVYGENNSYDVDIPFLVDLTDEEKASIEKMGAERVKILIETGVITSTEARTGYRGDDYTLNIDLDDDGNLPINNPPVTTPEDRENTNQDSNYIPDDMYWDALANITQEDLNQIAEEILE